MRYTLKPATIEGCDCQDCRAGRHLYELFRWRDGQWHWVGISLQAYANAHDCQRYHYWGDFGAYDTWEDGSPMRKPEIKGILQGHQPSAGGRRLNTEALRKSADALKQHWRAHCTMSQDWGDVYDTQAPDGTAAL